MSQNYLLEEKYRILMDFMPGGVVIYREKDGEILESNRGFEAMLSDPSDQDEAEQKITNFYEVIPHAELERIREMIETQLEFLHSVFLNIRLIGPEGTPRFCEYRGRILKEEAGERIYMAILKDCHDETMLRRTVKQLEEKLQSRK